MAEVARVLAERFGGATALPGRGFWVSQTGDLVEDPTTYVFAACAEGVALEEAETMARAWAAAWGEEAVAVEVDGALVLGFAAASEAA